MIGELPVWVMAAVGAVVFLVFGLLAFGLRVKGKDKKPMSQSPLQQFATTPGEDLTGTLETVEPDQDSVRGLLFELMTVANREGFVVTYVSIDHDAGEMTASFAQHPPPKEIL